METSSLYNSIFCLGTAAYCTFLAFHGSIDRSGLVASRLSDRVISLLGSLILCVGYQQMVRHRRLLRQQTGKIWTVCFVFVSNCRHLSAVVFIFRILSHLALDWCTWRDLRWVFIDVIGSVWRIYWLIILCYNY